MAKGMVRVQGIEKLVRANKIMLKNLDVENRSVLIREANNLQRVMISKAPTDTGLLKSAITKRVWKDKDGVTGIVVGVKGDVSKFKVGKEGKGYYPASQEYGWEYPKGVHHPPQPFIRPAFDENKSRIRSHIKRAYKGVIDRAGR